MLHEYEWRITKLPKIFWSNLQFCRGIFYNIFLDFFYLWWAPAVISMLYIHVIHQLYFLCQKRGRGMITLRHIFFKIFFYDNDPHQNDKCLLFCLCVSSAILECEYDSKPDPCPVHWIGGLEDPSLHGNDPHPDNLSCPEDKGKCRQHITSQKVIFLVIF